MGNQRKTLSLFLFVVTGILVSTTCRVNAEDLPLVHPIFTNHMVLQRGKPIEVWGWADEGTKLEVQLGRHKATAKAQEDGSWRVKLPARQAGGPYQIWITPEGGEKYKIEDVMVGEVWICAGGRDMFMGVAAAANGEEGAKGEDSKIRLFRVGGKAARDPQRLINGKWRECAPNLLKNGGWRGFSALGYYFAKHYREKKDIAVGLIMTTWCNIPVESWMSRETAIGFERLGWYFNEQLELKKMLTEKADYSYANELNAWYGKNDEGSRKGNRWSKKGFNDGSWMMLTVPGLWEKDKKIGEFDGICWYRRRFDVPKEYAEKALELHVGQIDDRDTTWVNDKRVGGQSNSSTWRKYDLPKGLIKAGQNTIAIRVLDTGGYGGITASKPEQIRLQVKGDSKKLLPLSGQWRFRKSTALKKASPLPKSMAAKIWEPTTVYNSFISPITQFPVRGVLWSHGTEQIGAWPYYRNRFKALVNDWRLQFRDLDLPFIVMQLPGYGPAPEGPVQEGWARLREAQYQAVDELEHCYLVNTMDMGSETDRMIADKDDLAKRALNVARHYIYKDRKTTTEGPSFNFAIRSGNKMRIYFKNTGKGLEAAGKSISGFAIAGMDRKWYDAEARLVKNNVYVWSDEVPEPYAVRYCWVNNPSVEIKNKEGIYAVPFRTDRWNVPPKPKKVEKKEDARKTAASSKKP